MAFIGDIYIPEIKNMPESRGRFVEVVHGLNLSSPVTVGFMPELVRMKIDGILYTPSGTVKTPKQYAEDIRALLRDASYNFLKFADREGFLAVPSIPTLEATAPLTKRIPFSLNAIFQSSAQFQRRFRSNPEILTNNFSLTFGAGGCDNYLALPIGATYSGGDATAITRVGKDGTITLVKANTSKNVSFDLSADEVNVGECKVWDSVVAGDTNESNWIRVFNKDHKFTGDVIAENTLYRVKFDPANEYITLYYYSGSYIKIDDFRIDGITYTAFDLRIVSLTPEAIKLKLLGIYDIWLERGKPPYIDTSSAMLECVSLTPADQSTVGDNFLILGTNLYISSNLNFSIVAASKHLGIGKKWIYYATSGAQDIAHQALVSQNLVRELIQR